MPWRIRRLLYLIAIAFAIGGLAIVVFVRDKSTDTVLLACMGLLGGVAIILSNLPNGNDKP
jgi:hypothetical protein